MRKHLFLFAAAVVAMSSCTQSEVVEISQSKAIGFNTYVGNTTRAELQGETLATLQETGKGFYVFGSYVAEGETDVVNVFDGKSENSHVTWSGSSWGYSPVNFWMQRGTYKFGAYAPKLSSITPTFDYGTNKMTFANFVADGKTDLLVAEYKTNGIEGAIPEVIKFNFKHALSKVRFTFIDGWRNDVKVNISNIKLVNAKSKGTLVTPGDISSGTELTNVNWSVSDEKTEFAGEELVTLKEYNAKHLFDNFLIPQAVERVSGVENQDLAIKFTVKVINPNGTAIKLDDAGSTSKDFTIALFNAGVDTWKPGYCYNYKLTISGDTFGLKPIQFNVEEVGAWTESDGGEILTPAPKN